MLFPPRAVTSLSILPATCPHCREHGPPGVHLVQLRVRLSLLPPGTADCPEVSGCVLCSPQIQQIMVRGGEEVGGLCAVQSTDNGSYRISSDLTGSDRILQYPTGTDHICSDLT